MQGSEITRNVRPLISLLKDSFWVGTEVMMTVGGIQGPAASLQGFRMEDQGKFCTIGS